MAINLKELESIKKLTCDEMYAYIEENNPDKLADFAKAVCSEEYPKVAKPVFNEDGTPKMKRYRASKDGKKTDVWKEKQIVEMVADETAKPHLVFNMLKAQRLFASWYKPELLEAKVKKEKKANGFMAIYKENETK